MRSQRTIQIKDNTTIEEAYRLLRTDVQQIDDAFSGVLARVTPEGGLAVKLTNKTGAASVKGALLSAGATVDNSVILQNNTYDAIGVFYEAGVPDGGQAWVVVSGIADVLYKDSTASTRGNRLVADAEDGRASDIAPSLPGTDLHFSECGHVLETKAGGTDVLVKCILHFN